MSDDQYAAAAEAEHWDWVLQQQREASLDYAWEQADAALPGGWGIYLTPDLIEPTYQAEGRPKGVWMMAHGSLPHELGHGDTPRDALLDLAAKLRERSH